MTYTGNFKAVYQRARAHAALGNEGEARQDFDMVEKLDPQFKPIIQQELKKLGERLRSMHASQNKTYWDTTQEKWGGGGIKAKQAERKKFSQNATEGKTEAVQERVKSEREAGMKTENSESGTDQRMNNTEAEADNKTENGEREADKKVKSSEMEADIKRENCESKADKERENSEREHRQGLEFHPSAETASTDDTDTEKNPDVIAEPHNRAVESGRVSGELLDHPNM